MILYQEWTRSAYLYLANTLGTTDWLKLVLPALEDEYSLVYYITTDHSRS